MFIRTKDLLEPSIEAHQLSARHAHNEPPNPDRDLHHPADPKQRKGNQNLLLSQLAIVCLLTACGQPAPTASIKSVIANPERLRELNDVFECDTARRNDGVCKEIAQLMHKRRVIRVLRTREIGAQRPDMAAFRQEVCPQRELLQKEVPLVPARFALRTVL